MLSTVTFLSRSFPDRRKCWRNRISLFLQQIANFAEQRDIFGFRRWRLFLGFEHFASLTRSEEHTSELQSLMRISYAVFCLKKKNILLTQYRCTPHTIYTP